MESSLGTIPIAEMMGNPSGVRRRIEADLVKLHSHTCSGCKRKIEKSLNFAEFMTLCPRYIST